MMRQKVELFGLSHVNDDTDKAINRIEKEKPSIITIESGLNRTEENYWNAFDEGTYENLSINHSWKDKPYMNSKRAYYLEIEGIPFMTFIRDQTMIAAVSYCLDARCPLFAIETNLKVSPGNKLFGIRSKKTKDGMKGDLIIHKVDRAGVWKQGEKFNYNEDRERTMPLNINYLLAHYNPTLLTHLGGYRHLEAMKRRINADCEIRNYMR